MNIAIVGTGYVGLVTGACFADVGNKVWCLDIDAKKITDLQNGQIPIYEPGLEKLVVDNHRRGNLQFTTDAKTALQDAEIIFIAVGTPPDEDGSADLQYVIAVAKTLAEHIQPNAIVVDKSTVPVGTALKVRQTIEAKLESLGRELPFYVCSNPEFLKEGNAVDDFCRPARIIVGTDSDYVEQKMKECYAPFNRSRDKFITMDIPSAELTKYAANAMLATKISFMNEIANIAEKVGADIEMVRQGIGSDPRIGYHFIYPGAGYGGSCFPKDVRALANTAEENGINPQLLRSVEAVNNFQKTTLWLKLNHALSGNVKGKTIAIWGLAFKPNTDDMRDAPSRVIIDEILKAGGKVVAFDPAAGREATRLYGDSNGFELAATKEAAIAGADALVICTEWAEFKVVDFKSLAKSLKTPLVIDGRNLFDPKSAAEGGIEYHSVGRPTL
ncbi:MAG: UDP-glucose/GDP-mannose dehydrogenase family protein [Rhizobiaceae bacterium]